MELDGTIGGALAEAAERWGTRTAVVTADRRLSFAELWGEARAAAKAVMAAGLAPGQRFAIWAPNSIEWQLAALGGQLAGGALVPLNTRYKGLEAWDILLRSKSQLLFTPGEFLGVDYPTLLARSAERAINKYVSQFDRETAERLLDALPPKRHGGRQYTPAELRKLAAVDSPFYLNHVLMGETEGELFGFADFVARGKRVTDKALDKRIGGIKGSHVSDILYTSGTTGAPKGVMTSHGQNVAVFRAWAAGVTLGAEDRYLIINPYFHAFGYKAGWLAGLLTGACIHPMPVFDADAALALLEEEAITFLPGPPTLFQSLLAHPGLGERRLESLRCAVTGAASVPVQLVKDMKQALGFEEVYTAYGLTEATGVVSLCKPGDSFETIATTCGRPMAGVEVQISDADGTPLPAGEVGEVWVRGFNVMQGYLDDPEASRAAITEDGWLKTGDLGVMDARGYLKITDRLKDMYICGGFNCYPAEIERLLLGHPSVADVAVLGVPEPRLGEVGHAFAVAAEGAEQDTEALLEWASQQMANYKAPRGLTWVDELPRNAGGKVQKFLLRSRLGIG